MVLSPFTLLVFDQPSVLPFLALVLIPIIVHLFNLRKTKKVIFSNTALLKRVQEETSSKREPKELLILLSRILAVILIVLAFAQPTIRTGDGLDESAQEVIIYLDNAPALQNVQGGESRINEAIKYAQAILANYPEGTVFHFVENSYTNSLLTNYTKESLSDVLAETDVVSTGRTLSEVLSRINAANPKGDVYLISDFQKPATSAPFDSLNHYYLAPVQNDLSDNMFIDTVYLENSFLSGTFTNRLKINVQSNNREEVTSTVRVFFGNKLSGTLSVNVTGKGEGLFEISENQEALDQIRMELEDQTVVFDNEFYLSINSLQQTQVVEVYSPSSSRYISDLFEDNEYFNFERISAANLNTQLLDNADMIIVNGVTEYSNQLKNELQDALTKNANVTIIPSPMMSAATLLPLGIRLVADDKQRVVLESPDFSNPFFDGVFEEANVNMQMPYGTTNYRLLNSEYDLLTYLNGRPFLSKVASPNNLFVFTTPFESELTSFVNHALFVPVFYRLALGSQRNFANLYYYTDSEVVTFPLPTNETGRVFQLVGEQVTITPDQRIDNGQLIMSFPKDQLVAGNYMVKSNDEFFGYISFNQSQQESEANPDVDSYLAQLAEMENVETITAANASDFGDVLQASFVGISLWRYALALGLLFLFVEIILIRYL